MGFLGIIHNLFSILISVVLVVLIPVAVIMLIYISIRFIIRNIFKSFGIFDKPQLPFLKYIPAIVTLSIFLANVFIPYHHNLEHPGEMIVFLLVVGLLLALIPMIIIPIIIDIRDYQKKLKQERVDTTARSENDHKRFKNCIIQGLNYSVIFCWVLILLMIFAIFFLSYIQKIRFQSKQEEVIINVKKELSEINFDNVILLPQFSNLFYERENLLKYEYLTIIIKGNYQLDLTKIVDYFESNIGCGYPSCSVPDIYRFEEDIFNNIKTKDITLEGIYKDNYLENAITKYKYANDAYYSYYINSLEKTIKVFNENDLSYFNVSRVPFFLQYNHNFVGEKFYIDFSPKGLNDIQVNINIDDKNLFLNYNIKILDRRGDEINAFLVDNILSFNISEPGVYTFQVKYIDVDNQL